MRGAGQAAKLILCFIVSASVCSAVDIARLSVRILDGRTGKPLRDVQILIGVYPTHNKNVNKLRDKTNDQGIAQFDFMDPIPDKISLLVGPVVEICPSLISFSTQQVLKVGLVADNSCKSDGPKYGKSPVPGELIVFARRVSPWEQMWREL